MRSMFTCGFIDYLFEQGIRFDGIIGVSAGCLFGCNFKSHQPGRALRYSIRFKDDPRYMGFRSFFQTGEFVNAEFAYHTVPLKLDVFDLETFAADPTDFWIVATDIDSGKPVYRQVLKVDDTELDWMRASGSMPLVSRPVCLDGLSLLDGGMTDSIPLQFFQGLGYERNIVVLTQPEGYRKSRTPLMPLFKIAYRNRPMVTEIMKRRPAMYNRQLDYLREQAQLGNAMLIYPESKLKIGRTEMKEKKLRAIYREGWEKAERLLPEIIRFLQGE